MRDKVKIKIFDKFNEKSFRIDSDYKNRLEELATLKNFSLNKQIEVVLNWKFNEVFPESLKTLEIYAEDKNIPDSDALNSIIKAYLDTNYREVKSISYHKNEFNWITKKTNALNCIGGNTTFTIDFNGNDRICSKCGEKLQKGDWIRILVSKRTRELRGELYHYNCYEEQKPLLLYKNKADSRLFKVEKI